MLSPIGEDAACLLAGVDQVIGLGRVAEHLAQRFESGSFVGAPVIVDIVRAEAQAGYFLQQIVLLVGQLG